MADAAGLEYLHTLVGGSLEYIRQISSQRRPDAVTDHHGEADHHEISGAAIHPGRSGITCTAGGFTLARCLQI